MPHNPELSLQLHNPVSVNNESDTPEPEELLLIACERPSCKNGKT